MPIDPTIASGVRPVQLESPINQMANVYALQNAQQSNQLNQIKMDEYKRGLTEDEAIKNYFATQDKTSPEFLKGLYSVSPKLGQAYEKLQSETSKEKSLSEKARIDTASTKQKFLQDALRSISKNPSNENITAYGQDAVLNGIMSAEEAKANIDRLLNIPVEQRQAFLASQGASASDLKPNIQMQNIGGSSNVISVPAYGGAPTTLSSTKMTATPGELLTASTQRRGQDITARGQDLTNARELEKIAIEKGRNSPEYIAMEAKMKEQGKGQAKFEAAAPQAIATAEQMLTKIDDMVGKPAKLNAKGQVVEKGTAAHPGFKAAVGASSLFPTMPGSKAADFEARLDEIKGGAFLEAYNTLRNGGSITEVEGQKGTQAITRMSTAQSEKEFIDAARDFQNIIRKGIKRSKEKLGSGGTNIDSLLEKYN